MKNLIRFIPGAAALAALLCHNTSLAQTTYNQAASFSFANGTNVIEKEATANTSASFRTAVAAAWTNGNGGVINFPSGVAGGTTLFRATYGNGKRMHITSGVNMQNVTSGTFLMISPANGTTSQANQSDYTLTFGLVSTNTGLPLSDEVIKEIGLPIMSRNAAGYPLDLRVTATFTDNSTEVVTTNIALGVGVDDTFFGFTAPSGRGIASIRLQSFVPNTSTPVADRIGWDDFGFITGSAVPPPQVLNTTPAAFAISNPTNAIQFNAMTFSAINPTNISLILNGTNDVSSQLVVSGDPTNYLVSYAGPLLPNQDYQITIGVTNPGGSTVLQRTFYTYTNIQVFYDSESFTNDTLYPMGSLQAVSHGRGTWVPNPSEPAQIVNVGAPQEKVLERQGTGLSRPDYLAFPQVSSGIITFEFDAFVTTTSGRTIDVCLQPGAGGNAMASLIAWGQDAGKLSYFDNTIWNPLTDLTNDWHHVKMVHYLSGPAGGTYDVLINGIPVGQKVIWRNTAVGTAFALFRIQSQDTSAILQSGRIDNLVISASPEDPNVFAKPAIVNLNVATNAIVHPTNSTVQFAVVSGISIDPTNITVLLDSNNITGSVTITGPGTNLSVSFGVPTVASHLLEVHATSSEGTSVLLQRFNVSDEAWMIHPGDGWLSQLQWTSGLPELRTNNPIHGSTPYLNLNTGGAARNFMREYQSGLVDINQPHYIRWKFRLIDPDFLANYTSADDRVHFFAHPVSRIGASTTGGNSWAIAASGGVNMGVTTNQAFFVYNNVDGSGAFTPINHVNSGILVIPDHIYSFEILVQPAQTNYFVKIVDETDNLTFTNSTPYRFRDLTGASHTFLHFGIQANPATDVRSFDLDSLSVVQAALPPTQVVLINPVRSGSDFSFSFASQNGVNYTAQYVGDVTSTNWTTLQSVSGDGGLKTITHTNPPAAHLFYRVSIP